MSKLRRWGGWMLACAAFMQPLAAAQPPSKPPPPAEAARLGEARQLFDEGLAASRQRRWPEARDAFERSMALAPRPITLLNLAGVYVKTEEFVQAADAYRQFLAQATQDPEAKYRPVAEQALADVEQRMPTLRVRVVGWQPADIVRLDGVELTDVAADMRLPVNPGEHSLTLQRGSLPPLPTTLVQAAEGQVVEVVLTAEGSPALQRSASSPALAATASKPSAKRPVWRSPWLWTVVGLVVAGGIAAGVYFGVRNRNEDGFQGNLPPGSIEITLGSH